MNQIKKLDQDLINKIAAGEVVERPVSIVKELIENAIDAQADQISIDIVKGGTESIVVQDNGVGMTSSDVKLAVEPHATSKISSLDDLFNIQTLGFRGEALSSVCAVSDFTIETKTKDSDEGTKLTNVADEIKTEPCGCLDGTKIIVQKLFHNVPARQKFLKSQNTEYNYILECFTQFALINPNISFKLTHNNKLIQNLPKTEKWLERVKQVLGHDIANDLIPVEQKGSIEIKGFIGKPQISRNNRKSQFLFINNRIVNDFLVAKAVKQSYGSLIPRDLFPVYVLSINLPGDLVDVNVHPRKAEVKFRNSQEIFLAVLKLIQNNLIEGNLTQQLNVGHSTNIRRFNLKPSLNKQNYKPTVSYQTSLKKIKSTPSNVNQALEFSKEVLKDKFVEKKEIKQIGDWRLIGQIHKSYLLIEAPEGILIMDQHAAAERVIYERYKKEADENEIKSQKLLLPLTLELSKREVEILTQSRESLQKIGFDIEVFGSKSFIVNAVPQGLDKLDIQKTILGLINDLEDSDFTKAKSVDDKKDLVLKYAACRSAVKFNDVLEVEEQVNLLEDIRDIIDTVNTCPHGRPFLMELTLDRLAKNFNR